MPKEMEYCNICGKKTPTVTKVESRPMCRMLYLRVCEVCGYARAKQFNW